MNMTLAKKILRKLSEVGVHEYVLCAGARNSPLIMQLANSKGARLFHFFEERSAAFFALGRIKSLGKPVAVITTSGTAVAELLPATIEAYYSGKPLILVSADRPKSYRNTGAPQSIEQIGIFSHYVEKVVDIDDTDESFDLEFWSRQLPLHINVCFDEPLIDEEITELNLTPQNEIQFPKLISQQTKTVDKPVVVLGQLNLQEKQFVLEFLKNKKIPVYAEAHSNVKGVDNIYEISEKTLHSIMDAQMAKSVLRIGGVPTVRLWRDLEKDKIDVPVVSCSNQEFKGLSRPCRHFVGLEQLSTFKVSEFTQQEIDQIIKNEEQNHKHLIQTLQKYPLSETSLLHKICLQLKNKTIYLGNSLPIREWDLVSQNLQFKHIEANRGANGIDGQVSTYLGFSEEPDESWCFLGDLTALYDLPALWVTKQLSPRKRRIVVINNHGGQIFKNIFRHEVFLNHHQIDFSNWAKMWNWSYVKWQQIPDFITDLNQENLIIELIPNGEQSEMFWKDYK
jgi:2-succinyl-5-enolpyruvyl-6-hydroxy-3-cyclohexene-1-carboxylate synthase